MAKSMARIDNGVVTNIEWCSDKQVDTITLVTVGDRYVSIGDTYVDGEFYRDGAKVLTPIEYDLKILTDYANAIQELEKVLGTNEIAGTCGTMVDSRKQIILSHINDITEALTLMEVTPNE